MPEPQEEIVTVHLIDEKTLEPLRSMEIYANDLGKIYLMAVEFGVPAEDVFLAVLKIGMERALRGERP